MSVITTKLTNSCKSRMELLVLPVGTSVLKPLFIQLYFTVYILSIYGRLLSSSFQFIRLTHQKPRTNSSQKGKALFTGFKLFSMYTDTNKTNYVLRENCGHWKRSSKVGHIWHFYSWEEFKHYNKLWCGNTQAKKKMLLYHKWTPPLAVFWHH